MGCAGEQCVCGCAVVVVGLAGPGGGKVELGCAGLLRKNIY